MSKAVKFYDWIKKYMAKNTMLTENGAAMYETSGRALLDMNFKVSSYRNCSEEAIIRDYTVAYAENPTLALKWAFYVGDVREGLGERRLFRTLIKYILPRHKNLVQYIAEYNRFDSMFELFGTDAENEMVEFVKQQLQADCDAMAAGKPCSLLAKWMPSINTASEKARSMAKRFRKALHLTEKEYRKKLSALRGHINVVEKKICDGKWSEIDYSTVPTKANLLYRHAFFKHDAERRILFLNNVETGSEEINSAVAFPHDIVHHYTRKGDFSNEIDRTLEAMWKALPDTLNGRPMIVVRDGSDSMQSRMHRNSSVTAYDVATALAIYCSERTSDAYKNKFITFSKFPRLVDMSNLHTLRDKMNLANSENEIANTNVEAVFDLLLNVAQKNRVKQADIPTVLIISDMEFDECAESNNGHCDATLFDAIADKWEDAGYELPQLAFWNVNSRTHGIPLQENECGVSLVSGFSPNTMNMVLSGSIESDGNLVHVTTDPYESMLNVLNGERYAKIRIA